jgi:hypothetical protein
MQAANFGIATGAFVAERDDWPSALGRARQEGWRVVELTAITQSLFDQLLSYLSSRQGLLEHFDRVSIHAPVVFESSASMFVRTIPSTLADCDLVFHPNVYRDEAALAGLGERALFENMDLNKSFGRTVEDLSEVISPVSLSRVLSRRCACVDKRPNAPPRVRASRRVRHATAAASRLGHRAGRRTPTHDRARSRSLPAAARPLRACSLGSRV